MIAAWEKTKEMFKMLVSCL